VKATDVLCYGKVKWGNINSVNQTNRFFQVRVGILCHGFIHHIPSFLRLYN